MVDQIKEGRKLGLIGKFLAATKNFWTLHKRKILIGFIVVGVIITLIQIFYPRQYLLPFSKLANSDISFKSRGEVEGMVYDRLRQTTVKLATQEDTEIELTGETLVSMGEINGNSLDEHFDYPLSWRIIPGSFLWFSPTIEQIEFTYDENGLQEFATEVANALTKQPINAKFGVEGDKIKIFPQENGIDIRSSDVVSVLSDSQITISQEVDQRIEISGDVLEPSIKERDYDSVKAQAEEAIDREIYFKFPEGSSAEGVFHTTVEDRIRLIDVSYNEDSNSFRLVIKDDEASRIFNELEEKIKEDPGVTIVKTTNGEETSRTQGLPGQGLDYDSFYQQLLSRFISGRGGPQVDLVVRPIAPLVRYERQFTNSNKGLQSYLDEVARNGNVTVSVQQLSGEYWSASVGGNSQVTAASTYKLFIAQFIMSRIDSGQLSWGSSALGVNVETCMYNMIVRSANDCSEYWIEVYGSNNINRYLESVGYGPVFSNKGEPAATTSNSLKQMLTNLYYRDGFSESNAQRLQGWMTTQIFRQGIPSGSSGVVSDKVGFLGAVLNDAAIVSHPKGDYVVVIMTKNESWAKIAEITREIERLMYGL